MFSFLLCIRISQLLTTHNTILVCAQYPGGMIYVSRELSLLFLVHLDVHKLILSIRFLYRDSCVGFQLSSWYLRDFLGMRDNAFTSSSCSPSAALVYSFVWRESLHQALYSSLEMGRQIHALLAHIWAVWHFLLGRRSMRSGGIVMIVPMHQLREP